MKVEQTKSKTAATGMNLRIKTKNMKKHQDFSVTLLIDKSPKEVFDAINNVRGWWSGEIEGDTDKLGAEFTYRYGDQHYSKQGIAELVPSKRIVWHVKEAEINFVKDKQEWKGTDIVFEIAEKDGKTEVTFTHVGLVPAIECYGSCSDAWGMLLRGNLRKLIATGKDQPDLFAKKN